jgi:D-alanine-D-alanine ligase
VQTVCIIADVNRLRVGVLYGGRSGEHEVSLASAASVLAHLDRARYAPVAIRIGRDGVWRLDGEGPTRVSAAEVITAAQQGDAVHSGGPVVMLQPHRSSEPLLVFDADGAVADRVALDVVFPVLHGPFGEDGTLQGLLELADVAYVGPGVAASAVGMDKVLMKQVFEAHGLPQVRWCACTAFEWRHDAASVRDRASALGVPLFVKPANLGSSVGISKVRRLEDLDAAIEDALRYDRKVIIEAGVDQAREIECAVLGNDEPRASVAGEIIPGRDFYDYEAKYLDDSSVSVIPADLDAPQVREVQRLALAAFRAIDASGLSRVDFLLSRSTGALVLNEINTMPGFTTISMFAKLWGASGVAFGPLLDTLIALARERHAERRALRTSPL